LRTHPSKKDEYFHRKAKQKRKTKKESGTEEVEDAYQNHGSTLQFIVPLYILRGRVFLALLF